MNGGADIEESCGFFRRVRSIFAVRASIDAVATATVPLPGNFTVAR
jgi:hypothetical protein